MNDSLNSAESIRRQFLKHEASIKSIGTLYLLGAILVIPIGIFGLGTALLGISAGVDGESASIALLNLVVFVIYIALGSLQAALAIGLKRLRPWARWTSVVFSAIGLLGVPIGTLISIYILYLLLSKKGEYVFSPQYQQVIAATPHIQYRTSWVLLVLLLVLVALFVGIFIVAFTLGTT